MFEKPRGLLVSEELFKRLEEKLDNSTLDGYYTTFNNFREQGLSLTIYDQDKSLVIWACECRNSDDIMVVIGNEENINNNGMFDDTAYNSARYFDNGDYDSALNFIYKQVIFMFKNNINTTLHYKFDTHKSINDIRKIQIDQENLDYEDYYELATFVDEDNLYMSDLIVLNGKMGVNYSKLDSAGGIEHLTFEPFEPNLENEITLMAGMHKKLDEFMEAELIYAIEMDENIKI